MPPLYQRSLFPARRPAYQPDQPASLPEAVRGRPALDLAKCSSEGACQQACPSDAIQLNPWRVDLAKCVFCGLCAESCPSQAITITQDIPQPQRTRAQLLVDAQGHPVEKTAETPARKRAVTSLPVLPRREPDLETLGQQLKARILKTFRRSLHIRHLDSGSCNGCDWEMTTLLNPYYDIQRFGLDFVASPRHADVLFVTGTMTRNLTIAAIKTYEAMAQPRIVIAAGACAAGGGVFGESYAGGGGTDTVLPVDIYVPGCPPRPQALLSALLMALRNL